MKVVGRWSLAFGIFLTFTMVFAGCRPRGVLSSRQMQNVLYDLHRADAILRISNLEVGHDEAVAKYYEVVLEKRGVTQAQFDSSLVWYTDHPSRFDKIYPKIQKRVKAEYDEVMKTLEDLNKPEKVERDLPPIEDILWQNMYGLSTKLYEEDVATVPVPFRDKND